MRNRTGVLSDWVGPGVLGVPSALDRAQQAVADRQQRRHQIRALPDGPQRTQIFRKMSELVNAYAPWLLHAYRHENVLVQPWVLGYKHTVFDWHPWRYYDIDLERRRAVPK